MIFQHPFDAYQTLHVRATFSIRLRRIKDFLDTLSATSATAPRDADHFEIKGAHQPDSKWMLVLTAQLE